MGPQAERDLARLRMAYARSVKLHGQQAWATRQARAEYLVARVRLELAPEVTGWADELDYEHRAALADALRDLADEVEGPTD